MHLIRFDREYIVRRFGEAVADQYGDGTAPIALSIEQIRALRKSTPTRRPGPGLGDLVAAVATPIARALGLPCIDPATQQLRPESGCAKRKADWNRKGEAVKTALGRLKP